jgi:hypothetical protein
MRWAPLLVLLLAGCLGSTGPTSQAPLPTDFTVTQPAPAGVAVDATYPIEAAGPTHLNATLVWAGASNRLDLEVTAGGSSSGQATVEGTVAHLEHDLYAGSYVLRVTGTPAQADTWHLEVHFTRN